MPQRRRTTGSRTHVVRSGGARQAEPVWSETTQMDPLWTEQADRRHAPVIMTTGYNAPLPTGRRRWRRFLYTLIAMVCGVLLAATGFLGWQWYQNKRMQAAELNRPLISSSIMNNLAAHTIMIPGRNDDTVYISELHTSYLVVDGYATVEIEDHIWYDNIPDLKTDSLQVTITPYMKTP